MKTNDIILRQLGEFLPKKKWREKTHSDSSKVNKLTSFIPIVFNKSNIAFLIHSLSSSSENMFYNI